MGTGGATAAPGAACVGRGDAGWAAWCEVEVEAGGFGVGAVGESCGGEGEGEEEKEVHVVGKGLDVRWSGDQLRFEIGRI